MAKLGLLWLLLSCTLQALWQNVRAEDVAKGLNDHSPLCTVYIGKDEYKIACEAAMFGASVFDVSSRVELTGSCCPADKNGSRCTAISNSTSILVALSWRGGCAFTDKAMAAQVGGFSALLVANTAEDAGIADATELLPMGGEAVSVHIPVVMITASAARLIQETVRSGSGDTVSVHVRRALSAAAASTDAKASGQGVPVSKDTPHGLDSAHGGLATCVEFCFAFASAGRVIEGREQLLRCSEQILSDDDDQVFDIEARTAFEAQLSKVSDMLQMTGRAIHHKTRESELRIERWGTTRLQAAADAATTAQLQLATLLSRRADASALVLAATGLCHTAAALLFPNDEAYAAYNNAAKMAEQASAAAMATLARAGVAALDKFGAMPATGRSSRLNEQVTRWCDAMRISLPPTKPHAMAAAPFTGVAELLARLAPILLVIAEPKVGLVLATGAHAAAMTLRRTLAVAGEKYVNLDHSELSFHQVLIPLADQLPRETGRNELMAWLYRDSPRVHHSLSKHGEQFGHAKQNAKINTVANILEKVALALPHHEHAEARLHLARQLRSGAEHALEQYLLSLRLVMTQSAIAASTSAAREAEARLRVALRRCIDTHKPAHNKLRMATLNEGAAAWGEWCPHFSVPFVPITPRSTQAALSACEPAFRSWLPRLSSANCRSGPCIKRRADLNPIYTIGFYSDFFRRHSSCRAYCGALIELAKRAKAAGHVKTRFEFVLLVRGTDVGKQAHVRAQDSITTALLDAFDGLAARSTSAVRVRTLSRTLDEARDQVQAEQIDALVFGEIGLGSWAYLLAATVPKLATTQITFWGHPFSAGLSTIDFYITSEHFVVPFRPVNISFTSHVHEHNQDQYVEQPVLFSSLSTYFAPPEADIDQSRAKVRHRTDFGLPDGVKLFFVAQSLFKLHPLFDIALRRILLHPTTGFSSVLVFLQDEGDTAAAEALLKRFERSLAPTFTNNSAKTMLLPHERVIFLPKLPKSDFFALLRLADVVLDTFPVGGGITTIDALAQGVPVVTLPSAQVGQCFAAGMQRYIGVADVVADNLEDYVRIATDLAEDAKLRSRVRERVRAGSMKLFEDRSTVEEWERFFSRLAALHAQF